MIWEFGASCKIVAAALFPAAVSFATAAPSQASLTCSQKYASCLDLCMNYNHPPHCQQSCNSQLMQCNTVRNGPAISNVGPPSGGAGGGPATVYRKNLCLAGQKCP